jgi:hypothetical protein
MNSNFAQQQQKCKMNHPVCHKKELAYLNVKRDGIFVAHVVPNLSSQTNVLDHLHTRR